MPSPQPLASSVSPVSRQCVKWAEWEGVTLLHAPDWAPKCFWVSPAMVPISEHLELRSSPWETAMKSTSRRINADVRCGCVPDTREWGLSVVWSLPRSRNLGTSNIKNFHYLEFTVCFFPPPPAESKFKQRSEVTEWSLFQIMNCQSPGPCWKAPQTNKCLPGLVSSAPSRKDSSHPAWCLWD